VVVAQLVVGKLWILKMPFHEKNTQSVECARNARTRSLEGTMTKHNKYQKFGGIKHTTKDLLKEALTFLENHPGITLTDGILYRVPGTVPVGHLPAHYADQGHYMVIYWEE
jgi:hypothetical protein